MSDIKTAGIAEPMPITGSSCGIKPSKEALDKGYEIDFSKANTLLSEQIKTEIKHKKKT